MSAGVGIGDRVARSGSDGPVDPGIQHGICDLDQTTSTDDTTHRRGFESDSSMIELIASDKILLARLQALNANCRAKIKSNLPRDAAVCVLLQEIYDLFVGECIAQVSDLNDHILKSEVPAKVLALAVELGTLNECVAKDPRIEPAYKNWFRELIEPRAEYWKARFQTRSNACQLEAPEYVIQKLPADSALMQDWNVLKSLEERITGHHEPVSESFLRGHISRELGIGPGDVTWEQIRHGMYMMSLHYPAVTLVPSPGSTLPRLSDSDEAADSSEALGQESAPDNSHRTQPDSPVNDGKIRAWMNTEGYDVPTLAQELDSSERALRSLLNNGDYHGKKLLTKLANLMGCDVLDLYEH
jgi:hypothetical protein